MKAAVLRNVNDMRVEQLPDPTPGEGEVVIRIKACGLCATDINMWRGTNDEGSYPFVPGHEWAGEVVEVGKNTHSVAVGDRVVGECTVACGNCRNCREGMPPEACTNSQLYGFSWEAPGGMADFHRSPEGRLHKIPDSVSFEEASLLEPLSIAYNGVWGSGGGVKPHDRVVVVGGGPIGMFSMLVCKAAGVGAYVIDPHPRRREMALKFGADAAIDPTAGDLVEQINDRTDGGGATLVIECSGNEKARSSTIDIVAKGGRIVLIGLGPGDPVPIDMNKVVFRSAHIVGSDGSAYYFATPLQLMSRRVVDFSQVITHRFALDDIQNALELGASQADSSKITLVP